MTVVGDVLMQNIREELDECGIMEIQTRDQVAAFSAPYLVLD